VSNESTQLPLHANYLTVSSQQYLLRIAGLRMSDSVISRYLGTEIVVIIPCVNNIVFLIFE